MNIQDIINELQALEIYFEEGRKRANKARRNLEQLSAPAPSGEVDPQFEARVIEMLHRKNLRRQKAMNSKPTNSLPTKRKRRKQNGL